MKKIDKNTVKNNFKDGLKKLPSTLKKVAKVIVVIAVLLMFYYALRLPRVSEGYADGMSYQDELFCDKIISDDSFTIQDFYFIRNYYNEGRTKAEFCTKLIGVFDAQYKEYLEKEGNQDKTTENAPTENTQSEEAKNN